MEKGKDVSLETLGHGVALEKFNMEMQKVLDNIVDPNTSATAVRKVTLTVTVKPNAERDFGEVKIQCTAKLAADDPAATKLFIGRDTKGGGIASEFNSNQTSFLQPEKKENVILMKTEVK